MIQLSFKATWLPELKKFHVQFRTPEKTHVEIMTVERYRQFCSALDVELEVAGWKLEFSSGLGDPMLTVDVVNQLKKYFRDVLKSYELSLQGHATQFHL